MIDATASDTTPSPEIKLQKILNALTAPSPGSVNFRKWFLQQFSTQRGHNECDCPLEKFAAYFFDAVRQQTYVHLNTTEAIESSSLKSEEIQPQRIFARPVKAEYLDANNSEIPTGLEPQTFPDLGTPCSRSFTPVLPRNTSTPTRRNLNHNQQQQQQQQQKNLQVLHGHSQNQRRSVDSGNKSFGTTSNSSTFEKSRNSTGDGSVGSNSFCLGDFLTAPNLSNRHSSGQKKKLHLSATSNLNNCSSSSSSKPKKRVVPITVSKSATTAIQSCGPFGANSSFSQENNILVLSQTEIKDFNKCAVAEARKALKNDLPEVSSVLKASTPTSTPIKTRTSVADVKQSFQSMDIACTKIAPIEGNRLSEPIVLEKIPSETTAQLKILASIYGLLVDMNLTTNVLHEISFLLNLLNANVNTEALQNTENPTKSDKELLPLSSAEKATNLEKHDALNLLKEVVNSIFFAICVLEGQQHTLALIDIKSLGVVLQCERLGSLSPDLKATLTSVYAQKQTFSIVAVHDISLGGLKNVCFQEDSDSRKFFQTNSEFSAFKTQRDLFYNALKFWEKHHLYPSWNFTIEVAPKVREIFRQSENPVTMTHFAKLFVAQLLISATEQTSPEEVGIGMDDVDLEKFNKLSQRLIAPSDFSVDYQFPREQAFFRDFIIESRSVPFIEHLKMVLFSELVTLNDSTFEQLNLLSEDGYRESDEQNEFIVRPTILGSLLILAKFLGFVTALPFQGSASSEAQSAIIQSHQLRLRRLFQPPVNICEMLEAAIKNGRHLITLPWIVQYLAMLDDVTLQLDSFVETTQKLYALYTALGIEELQITPTSAFIVRCCLGWLFEQKPVIAAEYLNYRITHDNITKARSKSNQNVIRKVLAATADLQVKSMLDSILCVACPFLAEFRVSIMPAKHAMVKYVSRSGRFRHITPCIAGPHRSGDQIPQPLSTMNPIALNNPPTIETASRNRQKVLMESFLHAQNSSMRRLIVFLSERVYKYVIKDAQYKILLPSKAAADSQVNEITSSNKKAVMERVQAIYQNARSEAFKQWDAQVPEILNQRTNNSLEALLPLETAPIVKKAYAWCIRSDAKIKIEQWRLMNLYKNDFYCTDVSELTAKICNANANRIKNSINHTTALKLIRSQPRISDLIEEMQHWLYTTSFDTSFQPGIFSNSNADLKAMSSFQLDLALIDFLERLKASFDNTLPTIYFRLIGVGLVQLLQQLISKTPKHMTDDLIQAVCAFFSNDNIRDADVAPTPIKDNKAKTLPEDEESGELSISVTVPATTTIYHALITAPFVESLGSCQIRYDKLKELLFALIQSSVVTMDFVNTLFLTVFKEDLTASVLNAVSKMLYDIAQKSKNLSITGKEAFNSDSDNDLKSQLFMEVLADFSRDQDEF